MAHSEIAWRTEIAAHRPQTCDYQEVAASELGSFRLALVRDYPRAVDAWEAYIQAHSLAVVIEQASDEGFMPEEDEQIASRLKGCPQDLIARFQRYRKGAPSRVREYLDYFCYWLVCTERLRRTGSPEWRAEAPSGSPEVLAELMFKWGPRFRRHRWTW